MDSNILKYCLMFFSAQFKSGFEDFGFLKPTNYFEAKS